VSPRRYNHDSFKIWRPRLQQLFESMTRYVRKTTRRRKMKPVKGFLDQ
jgi:hypothetical protein